MIKSVVIHVIAKESPSLVDSNTNVLLFPRRTDVTVRKQIDHISHISM